MRRLLASVVLCAALAVGAAASAQTAPGVVVVQVSGPIDAVVERYLVGELERAEDAGAEIGRAHV